MSDTDTFFWRAMYFLLRTGSVTSTKNSLFSTKFCKMSIKIHENNISHNLHVILGSLSNHDSDGDEYWFFFLELNSQTVGEFGKRKAKPLTCVYISP